MLGLSKWAEQARFCIQRWVRGRANAAYAGQHPEFVFPPAWFMYETYALDYRAYAEDGRLTAGEIVALVRPFLMPDEGTGTILDWGCGPGRIVRHLPGLMEGYTFYGTDYNPDYVQWCRTAIKGVHFLQNDLHPPVALPDASCDLIYGISIFTHLSADSHIEWIRELYRLLKPGGVLLITVQGEKARGKLLPAEQEVFDSGGLVIRSFEKEGNRMFAAFQPEPFMKQLLQRFTILRHIPGGMPEALDGMQDTWIARRLLT